MGSNINVKLKWYVGRDAPDAILDECSDLFGQHYGVWSVTEGNRAGKRVRQSRDRIRELLRGRDARLATARQDSRLVAYAAAVQPFVAGHGTMSWVTQLVVHEDFRQEGIAKKLLFAIWAFSDHFAWGLVTSNPYAVRALEKATRRRAMPTRIATDAQSLLIGGADVPYINPRTEVECTADVSRINTQFFVDHADVPGMVRQASISEQWLLGQVPEGWEWFAFTFRDQQQIPLRPGEVEEMLSVSDQSTAVAYAGMRMDEKHAWRKHVPHEVDFVWTHCNLRRDSSVLDVGCGDGRHLLALAERGISGVGVDFVEVRIEAARHAANKQKLATRFLVADARKADLGETFDCVLCLYDVVGSHADNSENIRIVNTVAAHVKAGGTALISVMNFELTEYIATQSFSIATEPDRLLDLAPSCIMESSGNIFDPDHFMIDPDEQVVYRREQFTSDSALPAELLVRDRRFRRQEIENMCRSSGLDVIWSRFVRAGRWEISLQATDSGAKEILLLCRKS